MRLDIGFIVFGVSVFGVLLGALFASWDKFLTPSQMESCGVLKGLPFIAHGGMWGDIFIISPLLGVTAGLYWEEWTLNDWSTAGSIGLVASCIMHWTYTMGSIPEAHVQNHRLTKVGWIHLVYMALALTILILFYFFTNHPASWLVKWATGLLIVHIIIGTHVVLKAYAKIWPLPWFPAQPIVDLPAALTIAGCAVLMIWRSVYLL